VGQGVPDEGQSSQDDEGAGHGAGDGDQHAGDKRLLHEDVAGEGSDEYVH
jgi:hypothetical protein